MSVPSTSADPPLPPVLCCAVCQGCINVLEEVRKNTGPHVGAYLRPGQVFSAPAVEDVRDALMGVCYDDTPDVFYESVCALAAAAPPCSH